MEILRDQNHKTVGAGVSSVDSITPEMFRVDPVTGYLLVHITGDSLTATPATAVKRDQNHIPTVYGISSENENVLVPIRTDSNGKLLITYE
jgi:hypothetical protein